MMWFITLAVLVSNLGIGEMTKRFIAEAVGQQNTRARKGIIQLALIARSSASLVVALLIIILSGHFARVFNVTDNQTLFIIVGAALVPYMLIFTLANVFAGFQKYEYSTYVELVISPIRVGLVLILLVFGYGMSEILIMYAVLWAAGLLVGLYLTNRLEPLRNLFAPSLLEPTVRRDALKYALAAMGILAVDYFLWQNAEVMFLGIFRPVVEVGYYNIAYRIPTTLVIIIPFVFGQVLLPAVSEQFGKKDMEKIKKIYVTAARYLMVLSFPLATVGIALSEPIIILLFGSEYEPAILLMRIVFVPFALRGLTFAVSSIIYGIKEPGYLLKIGAVLVCVTVGLNFWLIPEHGALGAVIATSIPRSIALPIYIIFVSRRIEKPWPMGDTLRIFLASVVAGLVAFFLQYPLDSALLSLCLSVPVSIITFIIALLVLRVVRESDLMTFKQIEQQIPSRFRRGFAAVIRVAAKFVRQEPK
jgi:O-antigen/teichoic acid export membrane protein